MRILGISGSLRSGSYNTQALRACQTLAPEGSELEIATLHNIPPYNADVQVEGFPSSVVALGEKIVAADAVLICTPEYNYSVPGVLKNGIDWLSRLDSKPFAKKPTAIMGASPGRLGSARAQYHLRQVLIFFDASVLNKPEVMISGAHQAFSEDDSFIDERTASIVQSLLQALVEHAEMLKRGSLPT